MILLLGWLVDWMIFHPSPGVDLQPAEIGLHAEEVFIATEDGVRVHAFYVPAQVPGAAQPPSTQSPLALLFLHGNAGNASHRLPNAAQLAGLGVDVLLLDYRGYGRSDANPSEAGVYADARAALAHLETRGFPPERVVLFGRSLGGAVAVDLAQERPLAGVILESTFTSVEGLVALSMSPLLARLTRGSFDSASKIPRMEAPLLFFHGDRDEIVDYQLGQALFELAPEPKEFVTLEGAGHNDTVQVGGAPYFAHIGAFLRRCADGTPAHP